MQLVPLLTLGPYEVLHAPAPGPDLAISFASIGHDPSRTPSPEFIATATGRGTSAPRGAIFIQDRSRSWANDENFAPMLRLALSKLPEAENLVALGMSMGAFSALVASQYLPLKALLAFVPQWSIAPAIMPQETRWQEWRARIGDWRWPHAPQPAPDCASYFFHAGLDDMAHAMAFPRAKHCDHLIFQDQAHSDLVAHLKGKGALTGLLEAAFQSDRRRLLRIANSAGGQRQKA